MIFLDLGDEQKGKKNGRMTQILEGFDGKWEWEMGNNSIIRNWWDS